MNCALCLLPVHQSHLIQEDERLFCCHGCQAVYKILEARDQLKGYEEHPVFKQAIQAGLISNPQLMDELKKKRAEVQGGDTRKLYFEVEEMWCPSCAEVIRLVLLQKYGVLSCIVDYATDMACVEFSPQHISKDTIFEHIAALGYRGVMLQDVGKNAGARALYVRFVVAAFCALNIMMFAYPLYATYFDYDGEGYGLLFAWLSAGSALPVLTYCAWPIYRRFIGALKVGLVGMEALVSIGVVSAAAYSFWQLMQGSTLVYFDSMSVVIALMLLGKIIESKAKRTVKESLWQLQRALPRRGRKRFGDGSVRFVSIKEIVVGDEVIVNSGEKLVVDGVVVSGEGACDESLMTWESLPVFKKMGSPVVGGTLLQQGSLVVRVAKLAHESVLYRIVDLVEQEISHKTPYERAADKIVSWFVPLVFCLAGGAALAAWMFGWGDPLLRALAVLLISCPCALGIAAPLAESYLMHRLAAMGAIVRNRACLRYLGRESIYIFDKTGTITQGNFRVLAGVDHLCLEDQRWLKTLVMHSNHPIASAIEKVLQHVFPLEGQQVVEVAGKGVRCGEYALGSLEWLHSLHIEGSEMPKQRWTCVYFAKGGHCLSAIELGDPIRPEIPQLMAELFPKKTLLLSGDSPGPVEEIAKVCGIGAWEAQCSPMRKRERVGQLREAGHLVGMIGDGINDALALAEAHVAITVVNASDISIQISDILLTTQKLDVLPELFKLGIKGRAIVRQNLFWAFFYNVIGIGLAMVGLLTPIFAAFAMMVSSLMVLLNARRLLG